MARSQSYTVPKEKIVIKQSVRAIRKYKRLIDAVIASVASDPSELHIDGYPRARIAIKWPEGREPEGFPTGRKQLDKPGVKDYNSCLVLCWLWSYGYTEWTPSKLFRERSSFKNNMTRLENEFENMLDIDVEKEYNVE